MILYFDSYITDIPFGKPKAIKDDFRLKSKIYAMPTRLEISKYTLASYSVYPWSDVLIKYQIDDPTENAEFEAYAKNLYPNAVIIKNRSATQEEYKKSVAILDKMTDDWVFYTPNNDHPLLLTEPQQVDYIKRLLAKAEKYSQKYKFLSVVYSHFSEYINVARPSSLNYGHFGNNVKILEEDEEAIVVLQPEGDYNSLQIANKELFRHWFTSVDLGNQRVSRLEDISGKVPVKDQIVVIPKVEIGAHFEGYEHMLGGYYEIRVDQVPSLFIPPGFFENNIRIAYGYEKNRSWPWVNINPKARKYSFQDPEYGTDLKIGLKDVPMFWKSRVSEIDSNSAADQNHLELGRQRQKEIVHYPWSLKNQGLNLRTLRFWIKRKLLRFYPGFYKLGLATKAKYVARKLGFY